MLEDFQDYHALEKQHTRDWMECTAFVFLVPVAYAAAVVIAVAVAIAAPEEAAAPEAAVAMQGASQR